jgi:phosphate transport system substrate-binding protein
MRIWTAAGLATAGLLAACGGPTPTPGTAQTAAPAAAPEQVEGILTGAGATFPYPLYSNWFATYAKQTGVRINYQSIGSGGGIRQFSRGTVDFGASDAAMKDDQIEAVQGNVRHVPTVIGSVVLTYNLPTAGEEKLRLDPALVADIYLGRVTSWRDPRIKALNPTITFPNLDIVVTYRSDGSGTTFVFTDYLAKVSNDWTQQVGRGTAVRWPAGLGGKGNEGVTAQVKLLEGGLGYVEMGYAIANGLPYADLQNSAGNFVTPSLESATAAADGIVWTDDTDFRVSITNADGPDAYPISSFTWLLIYQDHAKPEAGARIRDFLAWMITDEAQDQARRLYYAPLPERVRKLVAARIPTLRAAGQPIP